MTPSTVMIDYARSVVMSAPRVGQYQSLLTNVYKFRIPGNVANPTKRSNRAKPSCGRTWQVGFERALLPLLRCPVDQRPGIETHVDFHQHVGHPFDRIRDRGMRHVRRNVQEVPGLQLELFSPAFQIAAEFSGARHAFVVDFSTDYHRAAAPDDVVDVCDTFMDLDARTGRGTSGRRTPVHHDVG